MLIIIHTPNRIYIHKCILCNLQTNNNTKTHIMDFGKVKSREISLEGEQIGARPLNANKLLLLTLTFNKHVNEH